MRFTVCFICCFVFALPSHSQELSDEEPLYARVGFKGGVNYATISGDIEDPGARVRVHLGVIGEYPVTAKFFVQGELMYSAQGYIINIDGAEEKIGLNYISLLILAKYYFTPSFSLETGPQFSLLSTLSNSNEDLQNDDPFYNAFGEFDLGWGIGAGYWLESGLFFQLRYNLGLSNISTMENTTNRNSVAQFSVGYLFKTKNNRRIFQDN